MTGRLLSIVQPVADVSEALEVIDDLRRSVESGRIKAFACVGVEPDNSTFMWSSSTQPTTRLEVIGAIAHLLHSYQADA